MDSALKLFVVKFCWWTLLEASRAVFIKNSEIYSRKISRVSKVKAVLYLNSSHLKNISIFTALYSICMRRIGRDLPAVNISSPRMNIFHRGWTNILAFALTGSGVAWKPWCNSTPQSMTSLVGSRSDVIDLWRRVAYKGKSCFCLAVHAHSTLTCMTGAL